MNESRKIGMDFQLSQRAEFNTRGRQFYTLSGLHTHSDIVLADVPRSNFDADRVDVLIQMARGLSPIAHLPERFIFKHSTELSRIKIDTVADFEIREGKHIAIWPAAGAKQKEIEIFLLGPVWATLCHQRGLLPLHASAIVGDRGIVAFAGHSGAGKSTTAALMHSLQYQLFADDILPIAFNENSEPGAWPYLRRLKLRRDAIHHLALTPSSPVSERLDSEKHFVVPERVANDRWNRLERLYLLEIDPAGPSIEPISGAEAVHALIDQTYHRDFIDLGGRFNDHLAFCTQLASRIAIYRLRRSPLLGNGEEFRSLVRTHIETTTAG